MRKVVAYELVAVDGVAEDPQDFFTEFDSVMRENLGRVIDNQDAVLLGRRTFDAWADFLAQQHDSAIRRLHQHGTEIRRNVGHARMHLGSFDRHRHGSHERRRRTEEADRSRHRNPRSISLTKSLLASGLVDELRLVVAPVLQGRGQRLFDEQTSTRMALTRTVVSPSGYLLLDYVLSK